MDLPGSAADLVAVWHKTPKKLLALAGAAAVGVALDRQLMLVGDIKELLTLSSLLREGKRFRADHTLVPDVLAQAVRRFWHQLCLMYKDRALTYAQGLTPGDTVALLMENRPEFVITWLGLTKVGVVAVLVNTHLLADGLLHCVKLAHPKLRDVTIHVYGDGLAPWKETPQYAFAQSMDEQLAQMRADPLPLGAATWHHVRASDGRELSPDARNLVAVESAVKMYHPSHAGNSSEAAWDPLHLQFYANASSSSKATSMSFQVLQYNVFGRPGEVSKDGQSERLARVPAALLALVSHDIDVVTFAEADNKGEREGMLAQFRAHGFAFATTILHDPDPFTSLLNGGVLVVSKWPIVREAQHVYRNACHYSDCLAAKGVKYVRVLKTVDHTTKIFNVFATHMQAWSTPQGRDDRTKQAQQMREFVDALEIPHHEPLIFAGDFNVDNHTFVDEVEHLVALLGAHAPQQIGEQAFTSDPHTNVLVGRDGAANSNKCSAQYEESWGPPINGTFSPTMLTRVPCGNSTHMTKPKFHWRNPFGRDRSGGGHAPVFYALDEKPMCYCPCCPREWLDYVLYAQAPYQQPLREPTLESFQLRVVPPFPAKWSGSKVSAATMNLVDLSDHYPVLGKFEFAVDRSAPGRDDDPLSVHLDGCSTDDDCRFRAFRCYCAGDQCFFQGKNMSGWDQDSHAPINRNCLLQKTSVQCLCGPN